MPNRAGRALWLACVPTAIVMLLAGCGGTASAANGQSTAACPTNGANLKSVSGVIATLTSASATVKTTSGANATVLFTATTRFSKMVAVDPATLASGTTVQVIVQQSSQTSSVIPAQFVLLQNGQGLFNGGPRQGGGSSTGSSTGGGRSFNSACRRARASPGQNGFRGVRGTITAVNAGQKQITVTDQQGNSFVFALANVTVATQGRATLSDLAVGDTITASGQQTANGLQALMVQDLKAAK